MVTSHISSPLERFTSLFSPPRPIHESGAPNSEDEDHNKNSTKTVISSRCEFHFSDGRQCRNQQGQFCVHHALRKEQECRGNGFPDEGLVALCGDLTTATNINRALSHVFLLMAQGRIPQKQAVAFGYITQLLLQTVPGIRSEYVSVHGYQAWETNLKSKITPLLPTPATAPASAGEDSGEGQERTPQENEQPSIGVVERQKGVPHTPFLPHEKVPPSPDYDNLLRRSRNLLDRKYDPTPEGPREANALALELELMNPAPAQPRRDFFARTVALLRP